MFRSQTSGNHFIASQMVRQRSPLFIHSIKHHLAKFCLVDPPSHHPDVILWIVQLRHRGQRFLPEISIRRFPIKLHRSLQVSSQSKVGPRTIDFCTFDLAMKLWLDLLWHLRTRSRTVRLQTCHIACPSGRVDETVDQAFRYHGCELPHPWIRY